MKCIPNTTKVLRPKHFSLNLRRFYETAPMIPTGYLRMRMRKHRDCIQSQPMVPCQRWTRKRKKMKKKKITKKSRFQVQDTTPVWSTFYCIALATLFATAFLVYLHTSEPSLKNPLGDTIYATLKKSFHLLAVDTVVAVVVAALWLALLRNFLRPLTWLIVFSVPIILFAFTLWPFIVSFKGTWGGHSSQDKIMRIFFRHSAHRVTALDVFCHSVSSLSWSEPYKFLSWLAKSWPPRLRYSWLDLLHSHQPSFGFGCGSPCFRECFWKDILSKKLFVIDASTWWLAVFYILMLLWTQMIIAGIPTRHHGLQQSVSGIFIDHSQTTSSSRDIVLASFNHATGPLLGTICLSALVDLMIRLPLLILPRRFSGWFTMIVYRIVPAPLASITDPLVLTYAAIPLAASGPSHLVASVCSRLHLQLRVSFEEILPSNLMGSQPIVPLMQLLHATRQIMTLALGLGAWVSTARYTQLSGAGYAGSLYAYIVGMGAGNHGMVCLGSCRRDCGRCC